MPRHRLALAGPRTDANFVSGSGKSSLAFDTIYAEGQRRYVESLSAYARQFLERMEKPDVDRIEGICPAIAIRQKNSVRNPRSTVGTTTEIHDYMRLLFARVGRTFCRSAAGGDSRDRRGRGRRLSELPRGTRLLIGFEMPVVDVEAIARPIGTKAMKTESDDEGDEARRNATARRERPGDDDRSDSADAREPARRGFGRLLIDGARSPSTKSIARRSPAERRSRSSSIACRSTATCAPPHRLDRDRVSRRRRRGALPSRSGRDDPGDRRRAMCSPSASSAGAAASPTRRRSRGSSRSTTRSAPARPVTASATSSSSTWIWSCRIRRKSIKQGAIEPWSKPHYRAQLAELKRAARRIDIRLDVPWRISHDESGGFVVEGDGDYEGIRGFFRWLERKKYKVHVRVFLSRYRGYLTCPDCGGARLRREARDVRVGGRTIDAGVGADRARGAASSSPSCSSARRRRRSPTRCCARSAGGCRS